MNRPRRFSSWLALTSAPLLAGVPACCGHEAKVPKVTPPTQCYVVLDLTGAPLSGVDRVALNDANQAAFGLPTGGGYTTYTFREGVTTHAQDMAGQVVTATADTTTTENRETDSHTNIIDSQGAIYGSISSSTVRNSDHRPLADSDAFMICQGGTPGWIGIPPFGQDGTKAIGGMTAIGEGGFCGNIGGRVHGTDRDDGGFLRGQGLTVFNASLSPADGDGGEQIVPACFVPLLMNNAGAALGDLDHGGGWAFWDGQRLTDVAAYRDARDLNDQDQFVFAAAEGGLWEAGQVTVLRDTLPALLQWQYWNVQPFSLSNQAATVPAAHPDPTIHLLATAGGLDVGGYGTLLHTRDQAGRWRFANVALPAGTTIEDLVTINRNGVVAALGNGGHALLLLPVTLTNLADPAKAHGNQDTPITFQQSDTDPNLQAVAWIAAHDPNANNAPRMPQLRASLPGLPGCAIYWKLQVVFHDHNNNPHRDFDTGDPNDANSSPYLLTDPYVNPSSYTASTPDQVVIPAANATAQDPDDVSTWHRTDGTAPWKIYQDPDWTAAVGQGFFGGDAVLSVVVKSSEGNAVLAPKTDFKFRIAGEKPDFNLCDAFINDNCDRYWYAYAIARQETAGEGSLGFYNHFLDSGGKSVPKPGKEGVPDWNDDKVNHARLTGTGGYGLFQLTYQAANNAHDTGDADYIMPRRWIWNWQSNVGPAIKKLQQKERAATSLYNWLISNFGTSLQSQTCPTSGNDQGAFNAYDGILIAMFNGSDGFTTVRGTDGTKRSSPWKIEHGQWIFTGRYTINVAGRLN